MENVFGFENCEEIIFGIGEVLDVAVCDVHDGLIVSLIFAARIFVF